MDFIQRTARWLYSWFRREVLTAFYFCSGRVPEPAAPPAGFAPTPTRVTRGPAAQAGALAKVTQLARVQRSKARVERRHLGRNRIHRQNLAREKVAPTRHTRNSFLHQPAHRNLCH